MTGRALIAAVVALACAGSAVPASAAPPAYETPQDAVAAIKRILKKTEKRCATDWARIDAIGFEGAWTVDVRIRDSKAGKGVGHWKIGEGWPVATNPLARALAKGCPVKPA